MMYLMRWVFLLCLLSFGSATAFAAPSPAAVIAGDYGVDAAAVQSLYDAQWSHADVNRAAFLALAIEQPLDRVVRDKSLAGDWTATENLLGITDWHVKQARERLISNQLQQILGTDPAVIQAVLKERYHPKSIALGAGLAAKTSTALSVLLGQKRDNRTWYQLGESLGLRPAEVDETVQRLNNAFHVRAAIGDTYGAYGQDYGYQDKDYYAGGMDIWLLNFANAPTIE